MLLSYCGVCGMQNKLLLKQETLLNNIYNDWFKMNKIINKFLLTRDKFVPELHLKRRA